MGPVIKGNLGVWYIYVIFSKAIAKTVVLDKHSILFQSNLAKEEEAPKKPTYIVDHN